MSIGFLPKLVVSSALMSPSSLPNFSPIGARIRVLWRILRSVRNEEVEEEKNEEIKTKFCSLVSYGNGWTDFLQIWYVDSHNWPARL